jgi:hypothetical protein
MMTNLLFNDEITRFDGIDVLTQGKHFLWRLKVTVQSDIIICEQPVLMPLPH